MPTLVVVPSRQSNLNYVINADRVTYVAQYETEPDFCTVYFGRDDEVQVGMSATDFRTLAR
jgi:hypothetical protein